MTLGNASARSSASCMNVRWESLHSQLARTRFASSRMKRENKVTQIWRDANTGMFRKHCCPEGCPRFFVMNVFHCKGNVSKILCWLDFEASITSKNFHQCAELGPILRTFRLFGASGDGVALEGQNDISWPMTKHRLFGPHHQKLGRFYDPSCEEVRQVNPHGKSTSAI